MSEFLADYLHHGLSDIVEVDSQFHESGSGHREETDEIVAARKGNKYVLAHLHRRAKFLGRSSGSELSFTDEPITQAQYKKYAKGKMKIDTPEALHEIAELNKRAKLREELGKRLHDLATKCPNCGGSMDCQER
jgi:hypothetical protein